MGAFMLLFLATAGCGLGIFVQRAMTFTYENSPPAINLAFKIIGGLGWCAQYLYQGGIIARSYHEQQMGQTVSTVVNAIFYTLLLLWWLLMPSEHRLKK
jgi:hypothetical protein